MWSAGITYQHSIILQATFQHGTCFYDDLSVTKLKTKNYVTKYEHTQKHTVCPTFSTSLNNCENGCDT